MANVYEQFLTPSASDQQTAVVPDQGEAIGPSGEVLNLQPNTGAANIAGGIPVAVTDNPYSQFLQPQQQQNVPIPDLDYLNAPVPEPDLPPSDPNNLTSNYTQSVPQTTPQANTQDNPYAQFLQPTPTPLLVQEQTAKPINLPAMPWYENLAKSTAAQTSAGAIQMAGGFERAGAAPITDISGVNAPFQRGATTKEATSAFDTAIADKQSALDSLQGIVKKQGFSTAEYANQISDLQQQIGDLQAQKKETLQLPQYTPEAQQQLAEERQQLGQEASALSEQAAGMFPYFGVNQQDTSIAAQLGRGFGNVIGLAPAMALGPLALPAMAVMGASQAYGEGYDNKVQELKQKGVTDQAVLDSAGHKAGSEAAVATVPQLAAYTIGGELTAGATSALMKGASPLARAAVAGTVAAGVNLATSGALRTMQGGNFLPNVEQAVPDLVFGGISATHAGMAPSSNPIVNQKEGEIIRKANAQKDVPLTPEQQKMRDDLEKRGDQWEALRKQVQVIAQQLQDLPEDHPDRPALREKARKIAQQMADLRAGKSVDIQPEQTQGDERFAPKPNETTGQNQKQETGGVSSVEGVSAETKPEGKAEEGTTQSQGQGAEVKGGEGETTKTTEDGLREAYPNTAFFDEATEAIQRLNSEDARTNKRPRFAPASLRDLLELKNNPAFKLADKLAGIFGKKIVFYKGEEGTKINGATGRDPALKNYIFLKIDGARPHLFTAGHELWHHIELYSPVLATDLRKQIQPLIKDWAGIEQKYKAAGYEKDRWFDEHIGDFLGDAMQDPSFWNTLAKKNPKTFRELATKTVDWLNKLLYQLKDWRMGGDYTRDIQKARDMLADGLNKFAEGKDEPVSEPSKTEAPEETPGQLMFQQDRPTEQEASKKRDEVMYQAAPVVKKTRNTIVNTFKRKPAKEAISYMRDAGDNAANIYAKEQTNEVANDLKREFKAKKDKAADALSFVIEAKGDQNELGNMRQKIENSPDASPKWKKKALAAIEFADNNFSRFDPIAQKYEQIGLHQVAQENANGIDTPVREGYVPHYQDLEEQELFGGSGTGSATGFRKMRTYDTFADSIAAGIDPKSINAVDLLQKRLFSGQKAINYRSWIDSLKTTIDPASGDPIATKVSIVKRPDGSSYLQVPRGYHQETLAGQRVAIKDGYEGIISALNDPSAWSKNMVGKTIQKTTGLGKSITLGLDTYHLGRIAIWNSLIKTLGVSTFEFPFPSYRKGATLLDQSLPEIQKMIANGEIPQKWAKGVLENKRLINLAVKTGYNVGGISDALHQDWIHNIPGLGDFNSWLFNSFQRGAMAESWLLEFQRYRNAYPDMSEKDVARMVSKDLNTRYGNLGRQGILKSKTAQDTARFLFLAPQWNEGLMRTELGALGQTGKALLDAATGKRMFAGVLARSVGGMMAAQFIANQMINYATRGTPTWDNPEEGIGAKLSAWIPDFWGGPGFFLNPMSLAMETTNLMIKEYERTGDALQTATDYLRSRSSVPMRPVWDAITNKNYLGTPYAPGQKWKGMLADSVPLPIAGATIYSAAKEAATGEPNQQFAGQYQKQLFSTFGIKLEQAPSDESRLYTMANHYKLENNIADRAAGYSSPYSELNHALIIGNMTNAKNAMTKILETRTPTQVQKYYKDTYPSMRLFESTKQQKDFLNNLNDEQRGVYDRAKDKRKDTATSALDLLKDMQ